MRKYKVLFTIPNFDTAGSGKALLKLALRLDKNIFEPHIACLHSKGEFYKVVANSGIPIHIYPYYHSMNNRLKGLLKSWHIRKFYQPFDLVHSFNYSDDYSEALACRMAGTKWIYVKKNMNWNSNAWNLRTKLANGVIAQNTDMMKLFFAENKNATLIGRGVDTSEFNVQPPSQKIMEEFGLKPEQKMILAVANLVPVKGIEFLVDGFKQISAQYQNAVLFIVGDDQAPYGTQLKEQAQSLIDQKRIFFTGKRGDVKDFQSVANIFVLPTLNKGRQEGSPVSLLEAMASGTLVLASDVAGIRDQLSELPNQLFKPGDAHEIALKLEESLKLDQATYQTLIDQQLSIIDRKYTIDIEVALHEAFYKKVLGIN